MRKILVVDDLEVNRHLLSKMLKIIGGERRFEVFQAENGSEAVSLYSKVKPDLILMDYNMPHKTGCETAHEIKAMDGEDYTPIIFITAMNANSVLQDALSSGGDDYIGKPFDIGVLKSKINAHLRIRELNRKLKEKNDYLTREQELIEHFFERALSTSFLDKKYIRYHMSPMSAFNGDLFLAQRGPQGGLYLLVGDFTGHGLSAAMGTLPVAMIFFKMTQKGLPIEEILREINSQLHALLPSNMFLASTMLFLDKTGRKLTVWVGGMPKSYWMSLDGELKGDFESKYMPLGIMDDAEFEVEAEIVDVSKGDKVYIFTDGVTEAMSVQGKAMFTNRLKDELVNADGNRITGVLTALRRFTGTEEQSDDITMVELTCDQTENYTKN